MLIRINSLSIDGPHQKGMSLRMECFVWFVSYFPLSSPKTSTSSALKLTSGLSRITPYTRNFCDTTPGYRFFLTNKHTSPLLEMLQHCVVATPKGGQCLVILAWASLYTLHVCRPHILHPLISPIIIFSLANYHKVTTTNLTDPVFLTIFKP